MVAQTIPDPYFPPGSIRYATAFDTGAGTASTIATIVGDGIEAVASSWWLLCPEVTAFNVPVNPKAVRIQRPVNAVVAEQAGQAVVTTSAPLATHIDLEIWCFSTQERLNLTQILESGRLLRILSVLGQSWNVRVTSGVEWQLQRWKPTPIEATPIRDAWVTVASFIENHYAPIPG